MATGFDASTYAKGKYIHASDLPPGGLTATIRDVFENEFQDGTKRPALRFFEFEQVLTLNKSQTTSLIGLYGANTAGWMNQRIELLPIPSNYQNKPTVLIRAAQSPAAMPTFNGQQMGQPPAAAPQAAPAMSYVEPTMTGPQADDVRRLWESQQAPAAPTMPQSAGGVTFK